MKKLLLKLPENRVRRNYTGGAAIDMLRKKQICIDCDKPEDWIASVVAAKNPGLATVEHEGISHINLDDGNKVLFPDLLKAEPEFYLGTKHYENYGAHTGFLAKLLDSSIRLHVQAHPTREYAIKHLNSRWGKLECYYIMGSRPGYDSYIRLGFQKAPTREQWRQIIETQDIQAMDACFEKVPVKPGEVWFVPGGLPHEPTDLVIRCEFERNGIVVPPEGRFMGKGINFALDLFDYSSYPLEDIRKRNRVEPRIAASNNDFVIENLIGGEITDCFEMDRLTLMNGASIKNSGRFHVGLVCSGELEIKCGNEALMIRAGDCYFAAAACEDIYFNRLGDEKAEVCFIRAGAV
jgi:mannose-6-phosphate isomerase